MKGHKTKDVVLLCNPQAGGRWRALADVLDSDEAKSVRRIVTDEIDDVREALSSLGQRVSLLCIYGGDGTIFRVINELLRTPTTDGPHQVALLGGGTMNVTARWCGMSGSPGDNFRAVMQAYSADRLLWREVPLVQVTQGSQTHVGFTFGIGPLVRILEQYESGKKGHLAALGIGLKSVAAAISTLPRRFHHEVLREAHARVIADGEEVPYQRFAALFANVTGAVNPFIEPFPNERTRDSFHFLSYAVSSREFAMLAPLLARAYLPIDPKSLLRPMSTWRQVTMSLRGKGDLPIDPRYVNRPARHLSIETDERYYTMDGELFEVQPGPIEVQLGPALRLAMIST